MHEKTLCAGLPPLLLLLLASRLPLESRALKLRGGPGGPLPHPDLAYPGKFHDEVEDDSFKSWDQTKAQGASGGWDPCRDVRCGPHRRCVRRGRDATTCVAAPGAEPRRSSGGGGKHGATKRPAEGVSQGGGGPGRKQCPPCPHGPRDPVCASDGHSYSSKCKMQHQACLAGKRLAMRCPGRCPCVPASDSTKDITHDEVCTQEDLLDVSGRLKDWFGVLYGDGRAARGAMPAADPGGPGGPGGAAAPPCAGPVGWMFERLDGNADRRLDASELSGIYQDKYEHCIRPFLRSCASPGERSELHAAQWCSCYQRPKPPCLAEVERLQQEQPGQTLLVLHTPSCDEDGYYRPAQCAGATARLCWCVDRFGQEVVGSRTHGPPDCDGDASGDWGSAGTQIWPTGGGDDDDQEEDEVDEEAATGGSKRGDEEHGDDEDEEEEDLEAGDEGGYIW
uniref:Testican-2-like isoform X1 n=1 Tax=Petromyzon marinus TaxID=7757 RepID=A0AAJ7X891_PETMA|nr:testican-2-like isoform X1 [Petromyzon marinus]